MSPTGQEQSFLGIVLVLVAMLLVPRLFERFRLPGLVGLIVAGIFLGEHGFGIISHEGPVTSFLAEKGKLMLMFFAGLEIDMRQFSRTKGQSALYGAFTFAIPLVGGTALALAFGQGWITSILIGSLLASHTLLALPILIRRRMMRAPAVAITIGGTIFTDIAAMVVLAICLSLHTVGFDAAELLRRLVGIAIYVPALLFGTRWLARHVLHRLTDSPDGQVTFMLLILLAGALGGEWIHLEGIVGAFIVGLAVGEIARQGPVRRDLEILGNTLFIPMFFLLVGARIEPASFTRMGIGDAVFAIGLVTVLFLAKGLAAWLAGRVMGFPRTDRLLMWSLSLPQVAATLAAALVANQTLNRDGQPLLSLAQLDAVLILVALTAFTGPILTQRLVGPAPAGPDLGI